MESALPVTLCYMLADLKAKMERHCHAVSLPHPSVSAFDSPIIECCTAEMTGKQFKGGLKNNTSERNDTWCCCNDSLFGFVCFI